jgi:hypothetical protein
MKFFIKEIAHSGLQFRGAPIPFDIHTNNVGFAQFEDTDPIADYLTDLANRHVAGVQMLSEAAWTQKKTELPPASTPSGLPFKRREADIRMFNPSRKPSADHAKVVAPAVGEQAQRMPGPTPPAPPTLGQRGGMEDARPIPTSKTPAADMMAQALAAARETAEKAAALANGATNGRPAVPAAPAVPPPAAPGAPAQGGNPAAKVEAAAGAPLLEGGQPATRRMGRPPKAAAKAPVPAAA